LPRRSHQVYSVKDLLALKDDPNRWIVENMIPRAGRTLVFGQGGTYKSTLIFDLCVALSAEKMLLRQFTVNGSGPVLLNSTEGSIYENKSRLLAHARAHAVNPAELPLYFCQQPYCLDDAVDVEELEMVIKIIKPVLIVLDYRRDGDCHGREPQAAQWEEGPCVQRGSQKRRAAQAGHLRVLQRQRP
jgi:hypothetical protein